MGRLSKRTMPEMFSKAMIVQEDDTIAKLKEEIIGLKSLSSSPLEIPITNITPLQLPRRMKQPRLYFDPRKMDRLRDSIKKHGVLEPILVRPSVNGNYEIISGERRWRCCSSLGKETIPAVLREMTDATALEAALIAHLLNEEISAIEQTESILGLLSLRLDLSIEEVKNSLYQIKNAKIRGTENSRIFSADEISTIEEILNEFGMKLSSFVSNRLPMLNLHSELLDLVRMGKLSPTNAVLINRQPLAQHEKLIRESEGLTKQELLDLIKNITSDSSISDNTNVTESEKSLPDRVLDRVKLVKKNQILLRSPQVQKRLIKIEKLLQEIESLS